MDDMLMRRDLLRRGALGVLPLLGGPSAPPAGDPPAPVRRPEDFGARSDGVANDTVAVQKCADASPGGMQLSPGRTYLIDQLVLPDHGGWILDGFGATLKKRDSGDNYALVASERHLKNTPWAQEPIQIHNLNLEGAGVGKACHGIVLQSWNSRLFNLAIVNMTGDGIRMAGSTRDGTPLKNALVNNWLDMLTVSACGGHGVHIADGNITDWYLGGGWIYDNNGWGVYSHETAGAQIGPRLHLYGNKGGGVYARDFSIGSVLQGVYFEGGQTCSIPDGWRPGLVSHCYFTDDSRLEVDFGGGGIFKRLVVNGCNFQGKAHIVHLGGPDRTIEAIGCLFDTAAPFQKTRGGIFHATRCWANNQDTLFDGAF